MLVSISTGFLYRLMNNRNEMISKIREFSPDGIELSFAYPQYHIGFAAKEKNLQYLKKLDFATIHSPWKGITYDGSDKAREVLQAIERLYKKIGAKNVVFHTGQLKEPELLESYDFSASVENADWRKGGNRGEMKKMLNENKNLKLAFDFAHALTCTSSRIPSYLKDFKDRIAEIHLSFLDRKLRDHWFLHKHYSKKMEPLLNYLKKADAPIVLECVAYNPNEIELMTKEIAFARRMFRD